MIVCQVDPDIDPQRLYVVRIMKIPKKISLLSGNSQICIEDQAMMLNSKHKVPSLIPKL